MLGRALAAATAVSLAIVVPATLASSTVAAQAVTMNVSHYIDNGLQTLVFSGAIESGAAGEWVEIRGRDCGAQNERSITSTQTVAGGRWRIENPSPFTYTPVYSGTRFRARWNDRYSVPYLWRLPLRPTVTKVAGRRAWKVDIWTRARAPGVAGKPVELQRLTRGQWVRVRRARLVETSSTSSSVYHEAVFSVPSRGLVLRVFVPAQTAAPCYVAGASQQWRS
jgi:hypothetical protein